MAKIIDFFSRRELKTKQDIELNDLQSEKGTYIGNIGKDNAYAYRTMLAVLEDLLEKLAHIQNEVEEYGSTHMENIDRIVRMLDVEEKFEMGTQDLMVSEEGHVWIVPLASEEGGRQ